MRAARALLRGRADRGEGAERERGPIWGTETEDLNATLLAWPAGEGTPEHVNAERDVVLVVLSGSATVTVDGEARIVGTGDVAAIGKGAARRVTAGPQGVRYVSVHTRRPPLQIGRLPGR